MHTESVTNRDCLNYLNIMVRDIESEHLSIFAGAGVSINSGFVDWKGLMRPIIDQLRISPDLDLALVAQFYKNEYGRHDINRMIFDEFNRQAGENAIIKLLGTLPIKSYWTTNYDSLIEDTLSSEPICKNVDVKINRDSFKYSKPNSDVRVYKMHGDRRFPDDAVITKNDYETYDSSREVFTKALFTELITNTFLFIGFSFSDPNLERILSIVKHTFDANDPKNHYCFMRSVRRDEYSDMKQYEQDNNFQQLRIKEMRRYGIQTILVDDFKKILSCLEYVKERIEQKRVFISGSITNESITNDRPEAEFIRLLAQKLTENQYKIVTGFGQNIGNYLLIGACAQKSVNETRSLHRMIEIYPLVSGGSKTTELRKELISGCGSIITLFGKKDYELDNDESIKYDGIFQELRIAQEYGKTLIPVGCTGFTSKYLWEYVNSLDGYHFTENLEEYWKTINSSTISDKDRVISAIIELIEYRNIQETQKLETELLNKMGESTNRKKVLRKVFLSFHYKSCHKEAERLRKLIDQTGIYTASEEEKVSNPENPIAIFSWIDQKLQDTFATILIYETSIFGSRYIEYEIHSSLKRKNAIVVVLPDQDLNDAKQEIKDKLLLESKDVYFCTTSELESEQDMLKLLSTVESKYK